MTALEQRINALFEELVPASGKADTVAGEIIRAVSRITYRNYNDGDHVGVGYGNETCNPAARYLAAKCGEEISSLVYAAWGIENDKAYDLILEQLEATVQGELLAHFRYLMYADRARRRGMERVAQTFQALAASEYYHARSFFSVLDQPAPFKDAAGAFIPGETFEYERLYPMLAAYAQDHNSPLAEQAYLGAAAAEKKHAAILEQAAGLDESTLPRVYVCPICGYVMTEGAVPDCCPVCGGPKRQYVVFGG